MLVLGVLVLLTHFNLLHGFKRATKAVRHTRVGCVREQATDTLASLHNHTALLRVVTQKDPIGLALADNFSNVILFLRQKRALQ